MLINILRASGSPCHSLLRIMNIFIAKLLSIIDTEEVQSISEETMELIDLLAQPLSLKQLARVRIRKCVPRILQLRTMLPLPPSVQDYLLMPDVL